MVKPKVVICEEYITDLVQKSLTEVRLSACEIFTFGSGLKGRTKSVNHLIHNYEQKTSVFR